MPDSTPESRADAAWIERLRSASELAAGADPEFLRQVVSLAGDRLGDPADFDRICGFLVGNGAQPDHDALIPPARTDTNVAAILRMAREVVANAASPTAEDLERDLRKLAADADWSEGELFGTVGLALSGHAETPPLGATMCLLGRAACIERLDAAIDILGDPENPILGQAGS